MFDTVTKALTKSFIALVVQYACIIAFRATSDAVPLPLAVLAVQSGLLEGSARLRSAAEEASRRDRAGSRRLTHAFAQDVTDAAQQGPLVKSGPYSFVRHPFYTSHLMHYAGLYLYAAVATLASGQPAMLACLTLHVASVALFAYHTVRSSTLEETALRKSAPAAYDDYCRQVPWRFLPLIW